QLDGMPAFAVLAVMGFHASILGAQGGYLGVESFFVLSGFLITVLLTQERARSGRIQLGAFYARRALRLLPALFLFLSAATAYAVLRPNTPETEGFGRALAGTIGYVANWVMAFESDFHTRVLSHTWTLSVEEQFYLLWPLMLVMLLGRFGPRRACAVAAAGAAGLTLWRIVLYERGAALPRVSWALDTRAAALLLGAAMGLAATAGWLVLSRRVARLATVAGFLWLVVIFLSHRYGIAAISF